MYSAYPDAQLLFLMGTGDEAAFTELYNRYWERLLFIAGIKLRDAALAEELVQDVFLDLWNRRETLDVKGELNAYLAVSMKYKVINAQARQRRTEAYIRSVSESGTAEDRSTENDLQFDELRHRLEALVRGLPDKCRITYRLSREDLLTHKEIAHRLNVTEKAVEANLARALKSIRKGLSYLFQVLIVLK
jgi:RNA polymerase sigma-70 factor (ECF subfamily)